MIFYTVELILKLISGPYRYFMNAGAYLDIFVVLAFIVNELLHPIKWILPVIITFCSVFVYEMANNL